MELEARMLQEPGSLWIVKPPGRNNGSGVRYRRTKLNLKTPKLKIFGSGVLHKSDLYVYVT
jgi:hypothetical protein